MIAAVLSAVLMAAAPPAGEATATTPAKAEKAKAGDMVCKKEAVLGSRMKQRVCMTQAEWDQRKVDAKDDLDAAQRNRPLNAN